jgi:hypothetical protein
MFSRRLAYEAARSLPTGHKTLEPLLGGQKPVTWGMQKRCVGFATTAVLTGRSFEFHGPLKVLSTFNIQECVHYLVQYASRRK